MKRTVALAILAALLLTLCACGKVRQAEEAIDAIGAVTAESGAQIEAAEEAVDALNDRQRGQVPNLAVLEQAQTADPEATGRDDLLPHDEAMSLALERKRNALETQLRNAVAEERFEDAAHLRDELKALGEKAS